MTQAISVAVIGAGQCSKEEASLAEEIGRGLARRGAVLICGGLSGVMEAACRGAAEAGGTTVGILPGENASAANPYVRLRIVTGLGLARNQVVVRSSEAVVAVGGAYGTLTEIGYALAAGIPVVGLNTWSLSRAGKPEEGILMATSAGDAVDMALALAESRRIEGQDVQHS